MHQNFILFRKRQLTASPAAPNPNTTTDEPLVGFAAFNVAPRPSILKPMKLLIEREFPQLIKRAECNYSNLLRFHSSEHKLCKVGQQG